MVTQETHIPHIDLRSIQKNIKAFVGNLKLISSPCMDSLIDDEYVDVIYVNNYPCIVDKYEELLDECLSDHPGAAVFDSTCRYKNGHSALMISETKEGRKMPYLSVMSTTVHC